MTEKLASRVWIEIEFPTPEYKDLMPGSTEYMDRKLYLADHRAHRFDQLLRKLGYMPDYKGKVVWWNIRQGRYCLTIDEAGGFLELGENGHWFNLDHMIEYTKKKEVIQRYNVYGAHGPIVADPNPEGDWVKASDCEEKGGAIMK